MSPHDPGDRDLDPLSLPDHAPMADWDAAYVLGALSPADRRTYEAHLADCSRCRDAVAELTALPGLLARVEPDQALSLLEPTPDVRSPDHPPVGPSPDLLDRVRTAAEHRRRRRTRVVAWLVAAAVVVAVAIAVPLAATRSAQPTQTLVLDQVTAGSPLTATIGLTSVGWGTKIAVECAYASTATDVDPQREWSFGLWVTTIDGRAAEVSSWSARNGWTVKVDAGTAIRLEQIRSVDIRSLETGSVLLRKTTG